MSEECERSGLAAYQLSSERLYQFRQVADVECVRRTLSPGKFDADKFDLTRGIPVPSPELCPLSAGAVETQYSHGRTLGHVCS